MTRPSGVATCFMISRNDPSGAREEADRNSMTAATSFPIRIGHATAAFRPQAAAYGPNGDDGSRPASEVHSGLAAAMARPIGPCPERNTALFPAAISFR